jgi:hypothetical protein
MQRFLSDRHDQYLMHENPTREETARSRGVQTSMDKIDELGLAGRAVERRNHK